MPVIPDPQNLSSMSLLERTLKRPEQLQGFLDRRVVYKDMGEWRYQMRDGSCQIFPAYDRKRRWSLSDRDSYSDLLPWRDVYSDVLANNDPNALLSENSKNVGRYSESNVFQYSYPLGDGTRMAVEKYPCKLYNDYSGAALRRLSLGDLDQTDLVVRKLRTDVDGYDHSSRHSSSVLDNLEDSRYVNRSGRFRSFLRSLFVGLGRVLCFPVYSLRLTDRWWKRSHQEDPTTSAIEESSTTSESKKGKRRIFGCLGLLFCFPCLAPMVYVLVQRKRNDSEKLERLKRREVFEESYTRRHGVHSKPYLQSQKARSLLREKRDVQAQLSDVLHLLGRIIKSAYGDALPRKPIRMPDEEEGEPPSGKFLTPEEIENLSPEELRKLEMRRKFQQFSRNFLDWEESLPRR